MNIFLYQVKFFKRFFTFPLVLHRLRPKSIILPPHYLYNLVLILSLSYLQIKTQFFRVVILVITYYFLFTSYKWFLNFPRIFGNNFLTIASRFLDPKTPEKTLGCSILLFWIDSTQEMGKCLLKKLEIYKTTEIHRKSPVSSRLNSHGFLTTQVLT